MPIIHLTARTLPWRLTLLEPRTARWLWDKLRGGFPRCLAACLMPRHVHLVVEVEDPQAAVERMRRTLAWYTRRFESRKYFQVWEPIPEPGTIEGAEKLCRQVRYVALNPCRAGYADDPLRWYWSTHRDVVGATALPWVRADQLAPALGRPRAGFVAEHHRYVSGDPSVDLAGSPAPTRASGSELPGVVLGEVAKATLLATRLDLAALHRRSLARRVFIHLARRQGWTDHRAIGQACEAAAGTVREELARPAPTEAVEAPALCLGDERLLHPRMAPVRRAAVSG